MLYGKKALATLLAALSLLIALPKSAAAAPDGAAGMQRTSVSGAPLTEPGWSSPASLFPLEEKELASVDLQGRFPDELAAVPVAQLLGGESADLGDGAALAWRVLDSGEEYRVVGLEETIDLSRLWEYSIGKAKLEILSRADPTDPEAVRYIVPVQSSNLRNFLKLTAWSRGGDKLADAFSYNVSVDLRYPFFSTNVMQETWRPGDGAVLKMDLSDSFQDRSGLEIRVCRGSYAAGEDIPADAEITGEIWGSGSAGYTVASFAGEQPQFTLVLRRTGGQEPLLVMPFGVDMFSGTIQVRCTGLYETSSGGKPVTIVPQNGQDLVLEEGRAADTPYYLRMTSRNFIPTPSQDPAAAIAAAYVGEFTSQAEAAGAENIAPALFGSGWRADYSQGVTFTVFDRTGGRHLFRFRAVPYTPVSDPPEGGFAVTGAEAYDAYAVSPDDDSWCAVGHQTVLILRPAGDPGGRAVTADSIRPTFTAGEGVAVYGDHGQAGPEQISGETERPFTPGKPLRYSTGTGAGEPLKDYWVTFVTQVTGGPCLFINGATNAGRDGAAAREIAWNEAGFCDIFVANIGDEEMTGLRAELSEAENVRLDDYWNLGTVGRLAAFTTTEADTAYGELFNVTKLRLVRDGEGEARGTLTVRADGLEPVILRFPAGAEEPEITTEALAAAVKYVPYSCRLQAAGTDGWADLRYTPVGPLPRGLELRPDGEIYGVPQVYGKFAVAVQLSSGEVDLHRRDYVLEIRDNTDDSVRAACDPSYEVLSWIGDAVYDLQTPDTAASCLLEAGKLPGEVFRSAGRYACFESLWLDGRELKDSQFTASEGSTRLVVTDPDLAGNTDTGRHTIAAEFREAGELRRTAQNYYIVETSPPQEPEEPDKPDPPDLPPEPDKPVVPDTPGTPGDPENPGTPGGPDTPGTPDPPENPGIPGGPDTPGTPDPPENPGTPGTPDPPGGPGTPGNPPDTSSPAEERPATPPSSSEAGKPGTDSGETQTSAGQPAAERILSFADVAEADWFYEDVRWACAQGLMLGLSGEVFAPDQPISQATIVTVLARLMEVDLSRYTSVSSPTVTPGMWYTEPAIWAQRAGLLPDNNAFSGTEAMTREEMAIMLRNYLLCLGIDPDGGAELHFEDEALMSDAGRRAFQVLYSCGIFKGVGGMRMDPMGTTTRAQFAALMRRMAAFTQTYDI